MIRHFNTYHGFQLILPPKIDKLPDYVVDLGKTLAGPWFHDNVTHWPLIYSP